MRAKISDIKAAGAQLLVVDPHESWSTRFFLKDVGLDTADIGFPFLVDPTQTVGATYGVAMQMRIHTELSNRPATFVIDRDGVVRFEHRGKSFNDRPRVDQILAEIGKLAE